MTTSSSDIESVFEAAIYEHSSIKKITNKLFFYDFTQDSELEISTLYYNGKVNCFTTLIQYVDKFMPVNYTERSFTITIHYYKQKDAEGDAWTDVRDTMETVQALVQSELQPTWSDALSFARPQEEPAAIDDLTIQGTAVWHSSFRFDAIA